MKIALVGYGKMGRLIEEVALNRGHEVVCRIDKENAAELAELKLEEVDMAIEFTTPQTAYENVKTLLARQIPTVCGTTGWDVERLREETEKAEEHCGWIWASNYSVGVNLFLAMNRHVAEMMRKWERYEPSVVEVHHVHKLDKPSGTAKTIAGVLGESGYADVPVESVREGEVAGIHSVYWESDEDKIVLTHEAKSRKGFAIGAVMAAEWLQGKRGFHTIGEVIGL
jgi:4-hydroxy-tetrahydrodipicolinate reductase